MKLLVCLAAIALAALGCRPQPAGPPVGWTADLEQARIDARAAGKPLLLEFTGSTWCAPCIAMSKQVFSTREFIEAAGRDFVLVQIDVPEPGREKRARDLALAARNLRHAGDFNVPGYPYIVVLRPDGREIARFFATDFPSTDRLLAHLNTLR